MTAPAVLASRVRKCRHQHPCPMCRAPVLVGQSEALLYAVGWCHADCVVSLQRGSTA